MDTQPKYEFTLTSTNDNKVNRKRFLITAHQYQLFLAYRAGKAKARNSAKAIAQDAKDDVSAQVAQITTKLKRLERSIDQVAHSLPTGGLVNTVCVSEPQQTHQDTTASQ